MKIVQLDIDENSFLSGIDAMALVEAPAIEEGFYYFAKEKFEDTYNDYPEAAVEAAKQGIKRNEESGNKCATQVGKIRAQQLANREPVSLETVRRMRAFLIRQKDNYELARDRRDYNACGYISYLLWGGPAALPWTEKILRQAGETFVREGFEGLEDACQPGYEAIGLKRKRGRLVPNCVPKNKFSADILEEIIKQELINGGILDPEDFAAEKVSIDYHDTLNTERGKELAKRLIAEGYDVYVISGADYPDEMYGLTRELGIADDHVYATGTNPNKIAKIKQLGITKHYDNNEDVVAELENIGVQFELVVSALPDYSNEVDGAIKVNKEASYGFAAIEEKQMLVGPAMIPNKLILRKDEEGNPYYVYFTEETIKKIAYKMLKDKVIDKVNIEHDGQQFVDGAYLVESWIVEDPAKDKSLLYGFKPVKGEWMTMYKIENKNVWDDYVKSGKVRGFSIEGFLSEKLVK